MGYVEGVLKCVNYMGWQIQSQKWRGYEAGLEG